MLIEKDDLHLIVGYHVGAIYLIVGDHVGVISRYGEIMLVSVHSKGKSCWCHFQTKKEPSTASRERITRCYDSHFQTDKEPSTTSEKRITLGNDCLDCVAGPPSPSPPHPPPHPHPPRPCPPPQH